MSGQVEEVKVFPELELREAVWHVMEIMERCSLSFLLLGDTAKAIYKDDTVYGDEITLGVRKAEFVATSFSTLKTLAANNDFHVGIDNFKETDFGYEWAFRGIPIRLHIIQKNYEFLKNPTPTWFWGETLFVPNPFDKYYTSRGLVK
jgi:hypothetical protein